MGKTLIIAEKPSVANDIAKALGGFQKAGDHLESDRYVLSSAVGHLLELCPPEGVEAQRGKWTFKHLPVIPPHFDLKPIERNEARLKLLQKLIRRKDVDALINACDAGREGELIFRNVVRYSQARQPIKRLWLQSMTPAAIRDGFAALRDDETMMPLAEAAVSRSEADWLVGINGTRAMTAFNSKVGGFHLTTVGRVQTPTLAIVVEREQKIRDFVSRDFWEVIATFQARGGTYTGRWFDEKAGKANGKDADPELKPERFWQVAEAERIRDKCLGKPGLVTEESKPSTSLSPLLFDLTSLQREANSRYGLSASQTLKVAQALYERHKVLTYPRTDSRALPEDYIETVRATMKALSDTNFAEHASAILNHQWVRPNKRIFNNAKVSDHFAIIPTTLVPRQLAEVEQKLYDLVTRRFLAVFFPPAEFLETTRITRVEGEPFKTTGKVLVAPGWLAVYGKEAAVEESPNLPPVEPDEMVRTESIEVKASVTKPPARYTEATLLSAMEGAGKLVDDDELRAAMSEKGLGTPATRAAIIEGLIGEQYLLRQGRDLVATAKAFSLMALLNGLGVAELTRPELTGEWEHKLRQIQRREMTRAAFMAGIAEMTRRMVDCARNHEHDTVPGDFGVLKVPCPKCGGEVHEKYRTFQCVKCDFSLWKIVSGRQLENAEVETLIRDKKVGPLQGFRSRMGKPFAAMMVFGDDFKASFDFGQDKNDEDGANATPADFSGQPALGKCPKCGAGVFEHGMHYVCEKSVGPGRACDFKAGKVILQQHLEPAQFTKLLETGKTDLLTKFISKRTGRNFEAFLKLDGGKVAFEFPPRKPRSGKVSKDKAKEPPPKLDFTGQEPVGKCPKCGGKVFESETDYLCEKSQAETRRCRFKMGKTILQQPVDRATAAKLLAESRTDLLKQFVSSKTGRPFQAHLILDEAGKVTFDFPPRDNAT